MKKIFIKLSSKVREDMKMRKRIKNLKRRMKASMAYCMKHADEDCTSNKENIGRLACEINMLKLGKVKA